MSDRIITLSQFDEIKFVERWYELAQADHFWMEWRHRVFQRQCKDLALSVDQPFHGLDIGCGHGVFTKQLEDNTGWTIDGADVDRGSLERNPIEKGNIYFYDIFDRKEELKEKYDFIVLYDVIEHIDDSKAFLEAAMYHLKPNGYFFINVPACPSLFGPYDVAAGHCRRYTKKMLNDEFTDFPIKTLEIRYWGFTMLPILFLRNLVTPKNQDPQETIDKGFRPPSPLVHKILKGLMGFETACLQKPFIGTSVMGVFQRQN